jgi:hypothetical protein
MLLKIASSQPGLEGIDDVKEAGDVLEKARTRLKLEDKPLLAKVLLSEGIYWSLLAVKGIRSFRVHITHTYHTSRSGTTEKEHSTGEGAHCSSRIPACTTNAVGILPPRTFICAKRWSCIRPGSSNRMHGECYCRTARGREILAPSRHPADRG